MKFKIFMISLLLVWVATGCSSPKLIEESNTNTTLNTNDRGGVTGKPVNTKIPSEVTAEPKTGSTSKTTPEKPADAKDKNSLKPVPTKKVIDGKLKTQCVIPVIGPWMEDAYGREPYYFIIRDFQEFKNMVGKFDLKSGDENQSLGFTKEFFNEHGLVLVLRDFCSSSGKWTLSNIEKKGGTAYVQFEMVEPSMTDDLTNRGFFIGLNKADLENITQVDIVFGIG